MPRGAQGGSPSSPARGSGQSSKQPLWTHSLPHQPLPPKPRACFPGNLGPLGRRKEAITWLSSSESCWPPNMPQGPHAQRQHPVIHGPSSSPLRKAAWAPERRPQSWAGAPQSPAPHSLPLEATLPHGTYGHRQCDDRTGLAVAEPLSGRRVAHPVGTQPETRLAWLRGQRSRASTSEKTRCPAQSHTRGQDRSGGEGPPPVPEDDGPQPLRRSCGEAGPPPVPDLKGKERQDRPGQGCVCRP